MPHRLCPGERDLLPGPLRRSCPGAALGVLGFLRVSPVRKQAHVLRPAAQEDSNRDHGDGPHQNTRNRCRVSPAALRHQKLHVQGRNGVAYPLAQAAQGHSSPPLGDEPLGDYDAQGKRQDAHSQGAPDDLQQIELPQRIYEGHEDQRAAEHRKRGGESLPGANAVDHRADYDCHNTTHKSPYKGRAGEDSA